ncbi:MAG: hypothetical protein JWR20_1510 [Marmoricola sp.]|nr:hypothetical protein [Marmoricola sp.]
MSTSHARTEDETPHKAGAFDIRNFIGLLIGFFGLVLVLVAIFDTPQAELDRADGLRLNLWAGLGMLVAAAVFLVWARLKPVIVPTHPETGDTDAMERPASAHD